MSAYNLKFKFKYVFLFVFFSSLSMECTALHNHTICFDTGTKNIVACSKIFIIHLFLMPAKEVTRRKHVIMLLVSHVCMLRRSDFGFFRKFEIFGVQKVVYSKTKENPVFGFSIASTPLNFNFRKTAIFNPIDSKNGKKCVELHVFRRKLYFFST